MQKELDQLASNQQVLQDQVCQCNTKEELELEYVNAVES
jgi:hypothetical protein